MAGIKDFIHKQFQQQRTQVDSARMELDAVSIPSFERVVREAETLAVMIRTNRIAKPAPALRVVASTK